MKAKSERWMWIATGLFSLLAMQCSAQTTCPWLNAATASGVLGGSATVEVNVAGAGAGACLFSSETSGVRNSLRIMVAKAQKPENAGKEMLPYESKCASHEAPLRGVGNEAILCETETDKLSNELVVGRVRDNIFTVAISIGEGSDPALTKDALDDKAEEIAKQVAGILF